MKHNRVLVFSTDDHLYPAGGAEQAFGNITERLLHIEFDLICARLRRSAKRYEEVKNVRIYRIGFGIPRVDGVLLALFGHLLARRLMKTRSYDLIWSIMASYGAFSAARIKRKTGLPFLLTLQEGDSFDYIYNRVKYVRRSFNNIFKSADGIQAISRYLLAWGNDMGFTGRVAKVIPNGVAIDDFTQTYSKEDIERVRESFSFPEDATILITSSRLELKNGIGDVITALTMLPKEVCFVVCGSGSLDSRLREAVQEHRLEERVRFMGFVDPKELPRLFGAADIFIRPSLSEGLGNAFLEAMAARLLVIGTNAGGIPDFLTDGQTGFVVGIEDPKSIVDTIERIRSLSRIDADAIRDQAEQMVRESYNWDFISREMEQMFRSLTT